MTYLSLSLFFDLSTKETQGVSENYRGREGTTRQRPTPDVSQVGVNLPSEPGRGAP